MCLGERIGGKKKERRGIRRRETEKGREWKRETEIYREIERERDRESGM